MSAPQTLEAGREMDALVAEKVMGWRWMVNRAGHTNPFMRGPEYVAGVLPEYREAETVRGHVGDATGNVPHFSIDIVAALTVLDAHNGIVAIRRIRPDEWHVTIGGGPKCWGATLPLAICRAALATVEVSP